MGAVVEVCHLTKTYRRGRTPVEALRGVDLSVQRGEFVSVMGASGSGKSTLLHILGCLDTPSAGNYCLNGEDVSRLCDKALSRIRSRHIGFVFQTFNLIGESSVLENVALPLLYQGIGEAEARDRAAASLARVGMADRMAHRPGELSGGEMQRSAIARALVIDPLLILADEPTGNLDSATGSEILALIGGLHQKGATVVMVTHDPKVAAYSQRTLCMQDGRLAS